MTKSYRNFRHRMLPAVFTALLLSGCAAGPLAAPTEETTATEAASAEATISEENPDAVASAEASTAASEPETVEEPEEEEPEFTPGTFEENTYTNTYLGIRYTLPEGMFFADEEALQTLKDGTGEILPQSEELETLVKDGGVTVLMSASDEEKTKTLNISVQDSSDDEELSEEQMIDATIETVTETLTELGFYNVQTERTMTRFLGKVHPCLSVQAEIPGVGMQYERSVCLRQGDYTVSYTSSCFGEDLTRELLSEVEKNTD